MTEGPDLDRRPWVVAHRGASADQPENTRPAFEAALELPIDGVEFDVQLTRDGVPVLFHDASLHRRCGWPGAIRGYRWNELSGCRVAQGDGAREGAAPLLALEEALALLGGQTRICLEVKGSFRDWATGWTLRVAERTFETLRAVPLARGCYVLAFDRRVLDWAARHDPRWPRWWNRSAALSGASLRHGWLNGVGLPVKAVSPAVVKGIRDSGRTAMVYTVNDEPTLERVMEAGVDVIMTDRPAWLCRRLGRA